MVAAKELRMKPKDVLKFAQEKGVVMVDLKFVDFFGTWQHTTVPLAMLTDESFTEGFGLDGSSMRGWQPIHASDMLIVPDAATAVMDPFAEHATLSLICNIADPQTHGSYSRDPRHIAKKAEAYLIDSGIGDTAYFGPEAEFFIFDDVRFDQGVNFSFFNVDSVEGFWNSGRDEGPNLGYKPRLKEGYFPVPPTDSLSDLRAEMCLTMQQVGLIIEAQHHEVASGGQCEIDMRFAKLTQMADNLMWFKYCIKNVAKRHGRTVTFMPKPLFGDNGSGMHVHQSIWKNGQPLFAGDKYAGLSQLALWYIGGIIKHAKALCALTNPTTNSYKRLVPGFEAPVNLAYSSRNRSAAIRIPMLSQSPKSKRIEVRFPDPSCVGYLAFSALLMAGLDGIANKIDPGPSLEKNIYAMTPDELRHVPSTPGTLEESLRALEEDHQFLLQGGVFTPDVIETWIRYKREQEVQPASMRPTPMEYAMYWDT
jgi:glutamine synthetase